jgi:hypothetical protein
MSCHGETHHAETEKSDFSHVYYLGVCRALNGPDGVSGARFWGMIESSGNRFSEKIMLQQEDGRQA